MGERKRRRLGSNAWRVLVARQAESGLSVAQFCVREGVSAPSFYQWRARLRGAREESAPAVDTSVPSAFVDLGAVGMNTGRFELRLELGAGLVLQLARG